MALVLADDGKWLYTANQRSGTISVIDTAATKTVAEVNVGSRLADLAATPDGTHLVAVDEEGSELILLRRNGSEFKPAERVKVSANPVRLRVSDDGARVVVTSLWSRRLSVVALTPNLRVVRTVDLPFAPRELLSVTGGKKVIVADSFGGQLAVVDPERGEVESVRSLPGHNMRGLALSDDGKRLLVAHQTLNPLANTTRDDIHWGNLATNDLRGCPSHRYSMRRRRSCAAARRFTSVMSATAPPTRPALLSARAVERLSRWPEWVRSRHRRGARRLADRRCRVSPDRGPDESRRRARVRRQHLRGFDFGCRSENGESVGDRCPRPAAGVEAERPRRIALSRCSIVA